MKEVEDCGFFYFSALGDINATVFFYFYELKISKSYLECYLRRYLFFMYVVSLREHIHLRLI